MENPHNDPKNHELIAEIAKRIEDAVHHKNSGRRTIITAKKVSDLLTAILGGNYVEVACQYAGIGHSTFYSWLDRGNKEIQRLIKSEEDGQPLEPQLTELAFVEFVDAIRRFEAQCEMSIVMDIQQGFKNDPRAAVAFLERRWRDRWTKRVQLAGDPENPIATKTVHVYIPDNGRRIQPKKDGNKDD